MKKNPANYFVDIDNNIIKPTDFMDNDLDKIADKIMKFKKPFWRIYQSGRYFAEEYEEGAISTSYMPKDRGLCDWLAVRTEKYADDFYKNEGEDDNDVKLRVIETIKNECIDDWSSWFLVYYFPNGEDPNVEKNGGVLVCKFKKKE